MGDDASTSLRKRVQLNAPSHSNRHVRLAQLSVSFHAASAGATKQRLRATVWRNHELSESPVDTLLVCAQPHYNLPWDRRLCAFANAPTLVAPTAPVAPTAQP